MRWVFARLNKTLHNTRYLYHLYCKSACAKGMNKTDNRTFHRLETIAPQLYKLPVYPLSRL